MKPPGRHLVTALTLGALVFTISAQEKAADTSAGQPATAAAKSAPETDPEPASAATPPTTGEPASSFATTTIGGGTLTTNVPLSLALSNRLDVIELERMRVEGVLVPVIRKPSLGRFLQLFNPFAPAEYGGVGRGQGELFDRAFADPIKTQPTLTLISIGDKPARPDDKSRRPADQ